jgi:hypothetical protein
MPKIYNITQLKSNSFITYSWNNSPGGRYYDGTLTGLKNINGDNISHFAFYNNIASSNTIFHLVTEKPNFNQNINIFNSNYLFASSANSYTNIHDIGDFNGDGKSDILIDLIFEGLDQFTIILYGSNELGQTNLDLYNLSPSQATYFYPPLSTLRKVGDVNGDGCDDIIASGTLIYGTNNTFKDVINYMSYCNNGKNSNCVYFDPSFQDFSFLGYLGDFNGDGYDEICFAYGKQIYVIFGRSNYPFNPVIKDLVQNGGGLIITINDSSCQIDSVTAFGLNINNDKYADLAISCASNNNLYVIYGNNCIYNYFLPTNSSDIGFNYHLLFPNTGKVAVWPFYNFNGGNLLGSSTDNIVSCNPIYSNDQALYGACFILNTSTPMPLNLFSNNLTDQQGVMLVSLGFGDIYDVTKRSFGGDYQYLFNQDKLDFNGDGYNDLLVPYFFYFNPVYSQSHYSNTFVIFGGPNFPNNQLLPSSTPSPTSVASPSCCITQSPEINSSPTSFAESHDLIIGAYAVLIGAVIWNAL